MLSAHSRRKHIFLTVQHTQIVLTHFYEGLMLTHFVGVDGPGSGKAKISAWFQARVLDQCDCVEGS